MLAGWPPKNWESCGISVVPCPEIQLANCMYDAASSWTTMNWEWKIAWKMPNAAATAASDHSTQRGVGCALPAPDVPQTAAPVTEGTRRQTYGTNAAVSASQRTTTGMGLK